MAIDVNFSGFRSYVTQDWNANRHALKPRIIVTSYRLAQRPPRGLTKLVRALHKFLIEWLLGVELPWNVTAGPGLTIYHGQGLVVNGEVTLGQECVLRQGVTIGNNGFTAAPRVGSRVEFGANAVVFGDVSIGDDAKIGACAVITKDVAAGAVMVGAAARNVAAPQARDDAAGPPPAAGNA